MIFAELKKSLIHSLLGKYALYIFQLVSLVVLARLIAPEAFGVIAAAQVIALFFQTVGTTALAPAIVYQEKITSELRDGVFSCTALFGLALSILFALLAPSIHGWFEFDEGLYVFYSLSFYCFFSALAMTPLSSLVRDSRFIDISKAEILSELMGFLMCVALYLNTQDGVLSLCARFIAIPFARFLFYYFYSASTTMGRPGFGSRLSEIKVLYSYAKYQILFNVVNYFSRNLDNLLLGKYFGASALGVYEKTYQVMRYPLTLFTFAITPALQPVLTKYKSEPDIVFLAFFKVASRLAIVGVFSGVVLYLNATEVVYILFGENWLEAAPFLRILALSIPVQMIMSSTGGVFQAFGKVREMFFCGIFSSITSVGAIVYGISEGSIELMCSALVVAFHINYIQCILMLRFAIFKNANLGLLIISMILALEFIALYFSPNTAVPESLTQAVLSILQVASVVGVSGFAMFLTIPFLEKKSLANTSNVNRP